MPSMSVVIVCLVRRLTAHPDRIREEVRSVGDKGNQTALDMGVRGEVRVLEAERAAQAKSNADSDRAEEGEDENSHTVEEG